MKRYVLYIIGVCLLLAGCDTHTSDNGELDGFWQVTTMENLQTGEVTDGRSHQLTWAFQGDFLMLNADRNTSSYKKEYILSFEHEGDVLALSDPYYSDRFGEESDDVPMETAEPLNLFGIYHLNELFRVVQLDGKAMCLESEVMRLYFRKY